MSQGRAISVQRPLRCSDCDIDFPNIWMKSLHDEHDHPNWSFHGTKRSLRCPQCSAKFDDPSLLEQHKQWLHNTVRGKRFFD